MRTTALTLLTLALASRSLAAPSSYGSHSYSKGPTAQITLADSYNTQTLGDGGVNAQGCFNIADNADVKQQAGVIAAAVHPSSSSSSYYNNNDNIKLFFYTAEDCVRATRIFKNPVAKAEFENPVLARSIRIVDVEKMKQMQMEQNGEQPYAKKPKKYWGAFAAAPYNPWGGEDSYKKDEYKKDDWKKDDYKKDDWKKDDYKKDDWKKDDYKKDDWKKDDYKKDDWKKDDYKKDDYKKDDWKKDDYKKEDWKKDEYKKDDWKKDDYKKDDWKKDDYKKEDWKKDDYKKDDYYKKPDHYTPDHYGSKDSYEPKCSTAKPYFYSTHSPTLKQCISIACDPYQSSAYTRRAIQQCYELERAARRNNGGELPYGW